MHEVTVLCTTYNRRKYIPAMLACFLSQTFTDSELLVIDDGSDRVEDLIPTNPRIRYVHVERLEGVANTIAHKVNMLKDLSCGEFIIKFDDDDWSAPGRIAHSLFVLKQSKRAVLSYENVLVWDVNTHKAYRFSPTGTGWTYGAGMMWKRDYASRHTLPLHTNDDLSIAYVARTTGQLVIVPSGDLLVTRSHGNHAGSGFEYFGTREVPEVDASEIPSEFFEANKEFGL